MSTDQGPRVMVKLYSNDVVFASFASCVSCCLLNASSNTVSSSWGCTFSQVRMWMMRSNRRSKGQPSERSVFSSGFHSSDSEGFEVAIMTKASMRVVIWFRPANFWSTSQIGGTTFTSSKSREIRRVFRVLRYPDASREGTITAASEIPGIYGMQC